MSPAHLLAALLFALSFVGVLYTLLAARAARRFFAPNPTPPASHQAVSLLKPLHGAEPNLAANLATFLAQTHAGPLQMVLGVNAPDDSALPPAQMLAASHPNIAISTGPRLPGSNGKIGNLRAMLPLAAHEVLVLSDSDMVVGRDYLPRVLAALETPGVGAVSCLYIGRGDAGLWSEIGAAIISYQQLPGMLVGLALGMANPCMGSTIALRRTTLDAIGGLAPLADVLADDHAIGEAVRAAGLGVAIPPFVLVHAGTQTSAAELWRHFVRWAVTVRDLAGAGHYGSLITHPFALALLGAGLWPQGGALFVFTALAARLWLAKSVNSATGLRGGRLILLPIADLFAFATFCASLIARRIDWRGSRLNMTARGRIAEARKTRDS